MPPAKVGASSVYDSHLGAIEGFFRYIKDHYKIKAGEFLFLLSFILNFVLGKLVHVLSPQEEVYNYYNDKKNIFNQLFVKKGWAWTTLNLVIFYGIVLYREKSSGERVQLVKKAVINYVLATIWWIFFTQWFFGMPIMDKIFVLTGGKCVIEESTSNNHRYIHLFQAIEDQIGKLESKYVTSYSCRKLKGNWEGGHDPSGHVFLLVHSSLYLFLEVQPFWISWSYFKGTVITAYKNITQPNKTIGDKIKTFKDLVVENPSVLVVKLIVLWWFMLFMTNIYFHSIAEKFVGLIFGYFGIIGIYYVPRYIKPSSTKKDE
ncbi:inositol phospholipid synthesis and fat-storage-inducing TM-domain-containing protein [Scheffersomyces xylosifermentans]|uniref:inositol phospholipid synthesis and fat-storage-inducing TM-domain-containing protein n=1 Tax=Scheffersomyces xylosifermentans TaxID=1304137 RepID=UPI00315D4F12